MPPPLPLLTRELVCEVVGQSGLVRRRLVVGRLVVGQSYIVCHRMRGLVRRRLVVGRSLVGWLSVGRTSTSSDVGVGPSSVGCRSVVGRLVVGRSYIVRHLMREG